jgi:hypothetical protein
LQRVKIYFSDNGGDKEEVPQFFHRVQAGNSCNPVPILKFLGHEPLLAGGNFVKMWCNVAQYSFARPVILPEKSLVTISKGDSGRGTK